MPAYMHMHCMLLPRISPQLPPPLTPVAFSLPPGVPTSPPPLHQLAVLAIVPATEPCTHGWKRGLTSSPYHPISCTHSPPPPRLSLMLPSLSAAASLCCGTRALPRTTPWTPATRRGNTSPASPMWWPETYVEGGILYLPHLCGGLSPQPMDHASYVCLEAGLRTGSAPACGGGGLTDTFGWGSSVSIAGQACDLRQTFPAICMAYV